MKKEFISRSKLIYLTDLKLRWPGALGKEIVSHYENEELKSFILSKQTDSDCIIEPYILKYKEEDGQIDIWINGTQPNCVFLLSDVELIEKENPDYLEKRLDINNGRIIESLVFEEYRQKNINLQNEIKNLQERITQLQTKKDKIDPRERKSYLKIIHYLFNALNFDINERGIVSDILKGIENLGDKIDDSTIRKVINEVKDYQKELAAKRGE